jgi:quinol monooxygenase YgiN
MIIVTGSVTANPDALPAVLRLAVEHVHRSRLEPGCLLHSVHHDVENPNRVVFLEHWLDRDALRVHFGVAESREFTKALRSLSTEQTLEIYEAERVELQHL